MTEEPKPAVETFQCPGCGASVRVRAQGTAVTIACEACGSIVDANDPKRQLLEAVSRKSKAKLLIPLGKRGKLFGTEWEVIGVLRRAEHPWPESEECLLFNPTKGLRWLICYDGHWSFAAPARDKPKKLESSGSYGLGLPMYAELNGKRYRRFHRGTEKVTFVAGEFHWRVRVGEVSNTEMFVAGGEALYHDSTAKEDNWSVATYVKASDVKKAFGVTDLPWRRGIGALQPRPAEKDRSAVFKTYFALVAVIFAVQIVTCSSASNHTIHVQSFEYTTAAKDKETRTESFDVGKGIENLEIDLYSPVNNHWLAIDGELVNETTGDTWPFEEGVEYYSGYDSDGSWSEGTTHATKVLSGVPPGRYHINLEPSSDYGAAETGSQSYEIKAVRSVPTFGNFWWALVLLSIPPSILWLVGHYYDRERWSKSDFSPYG